jgi:hypothetical protein
VRRWLQAIWQAWRIQHAVVDPCMKCPSCGARQGEIKWYGNLVWPDNKKGAIVHTCKVCSARWGEKPIVKAEAWDISLQEQPQGTPVPFLNRPEPTSFGRRTA